MSRLHVLIESLSAKFMEIDGYSGSVFREMGLSVKLVDISKYLG